jgi:DNA-binding LacI/PurR family transcriptional regulator
MQKRVTISDIATHAGCSKQTVGFILGGRPELFRPEMRARVEAAAKELGYRANAAAKAIRTGRFDAVGLLLHQEVYRSSVTPELLASLHDALAADGRSLVIGKLDDQQLTDADALPLLLRKRSIDGLLIKIETGIPPRFAELMDGIDLPAVWLNSTHRHDAVALDDRGAASGMVERSVKLGHRRIGYLSLVIALPGIAHESVAARQLGYTEAMRKHGLPPMDHVRGDVRREDFLAHVSAWLRAARPTAVICYGPVEASLVWHAAQLIGLRTPAQLSVLAFAGLISRLDGIAVSGVAHPDADLGVSGAAMLVKRMSSRRRQAAVSIPFPVMEGATCAPPPDSSV